MNKTIDEITDAALAISGIAGIAYLAANGVTNFEILGLVAGLGGYRMYNKNPGGGE